MALKSLYLVPLMLPTWKFPMLTLPMSIWLAVLSSDMVLLGPNERGSMFSVGQSSSFFANCSYWRGINYFYEREGPGIRNAQ